MGTTPAVEAGVVAGAEALADGEEERVCGTASPEAASWVAVEPSLAEDWREEGRVERLAMMGGGERGGRGDAAPSPHSDQAGVARQGLNHRVPRNR